MDMDSMTEEEIKTVKALEDKIRQAVRKIGGRKENDICRYLPIDTGGYMHHFTMRKMKTEDPKGLIQLIEKFIIGSTAPSSVTPKPRAARGSRKRRDGMNFSRIELERLLAMAKRMGDHDMITKLSPKKSLAAYKRDLIASIRHNEANEALWRDYIEALAAAKAETAEEVAAMHGGHVVSSNFNLS